MNKALKTITMVYYAFYATTLLSALMGFMLTRDSQTSIVAKSPLGITISSIVILYLLVSIPLALAGFYRLSQQWKTIEDEATKLEKYTKYSIIRLALIGTAMEISIIAFYFMRSEMSLLYCFGIAAVALIFCKPSARKIISELDLDEE